MKKLITTCLIISFVIFGSLRVMSQSSEATTYYNQGIDFYNLNKIEDSIKSFKKAIELDPKFYQAYYNLAKIQESYKYYNDAMVTYEKLIEITPEDYESMFNFGNLLYKRGYLKKSLTYLDRIPNYSDYYEQAEKLIAIVEKRQVEVAQELKLKEDMLKKSSLLEKTIQAPTGVATDKLGNVYIASFAQNTVYKITPQNVKTTFVGPNNLSGPVGIAIDDNNNIYIANYTKGNIVKAEPDGKTTVLLLVKKPYCLNVDNQNKKLIITEQEKNTVIKFDLSN